MQANAYAQPGSRIPARPAVRPVRPLRLAAGGAAIALRVADSAVNVSSSRAMDRVVRSRAWVIILGLGLIGIVAMQVSMLKLNAGIGRAVESAATLERSNASLKAEVSRMSSGDRIQALAGQKGFLMPEPADVTYLRAGDKRADSVRAARRMRAPDFSIAGPAGSVTAVPETLTGTPAATTTGAAGAPGMATADATAPAATATATGTAAPAAASAPPVTGPATPSAATSPSATTTTLPAGAAATAPTAPTAPAQTAPQTTSAGGVTLP